MQSKIDNLNSKYTKQGGNVQVACLRALIFKSKNFN